MADIERGKLPHAKPVIGLVGGIGSGKSLVGELLAEQGGYLIVADHLGHEALRQPDVRDRLVSRWGREILKEDGEIDRRRVAGIVFAKEEERQALEAAVFPYLDERIREELAKAEANPDVRFVILDAAILLETGWKRVCDYVVFVAAPRAVRLARLAATRNWTDADLAAREIAQLPVAEKQAQADAIVNNGGDLAQARAEVAMLVDRLRLRL